MIQNSQQYAKTLFEVCKKIDNIDQTKNQLQTIAYLFNKIPAFRLVLISKRLKNNDKVDIISKSLNTFSPLIIEFLAIIIRKNHINHLLDIITRFNNLARSNRCTNNIEIITANKLNEQDFQFISKTIGEKLGLIPKIIASVDSRVIGGIKLRIGNNIFDNSISYQINQLKKTLHNM